MGGYGHNGSGDLFVAFSTGNTITDNPKQLERIDVLPPASMNELFHGVADAVEEAIINALCAAETTIGYAGRTAHAIPSARMADIVRGTGLFHTPADIQS